MALTSHFPLPKTLQSSKQLAFFRNKRTNFQLHRPSPHRKNEYQKQLEIEKEIVREVARGDKPYLRKSTDRKAQISPLNWANAFLICALRSVDFLR